MAEQQTIARKPRRPLLDEATILSWADEHYRLHGRWPNGADGMIAGVEGETWVAVALSIRGGRRGLSGDTTLARLLQKHRGKRHQHDAVRLTHDRIAAWVDAFAARHGKYPTSTDGPIDGAPGETWAKMDSALRQGYRGLPGGSSLPHFLQEHFGRRHPQDLPPLSDELILEWADNHYKNHGIWPNQKSGPIDASPAETWYLVNRAMHYGHRGLPGGSSLARLLARERGTRNPAGLANLTVDRINEWLRVYYERNGKYPSSHSGTIEGAPGETWRGIDRALMQGRRGLTGGSSLSRFIDEGIGKHHVRSANHFTEEVIRTWARNYFRKHGAWPRTISGPVEDNPNETWYNINCALRIGHRGLPGGSSLAKICAKEAAVRY